MKCLFCVKKNVSEECVLSIEGFNSPIRKITCSNCGIYAIDDFIFYSLNSGDKGMLDAVNSSFKDFKHGYIQDINKATKEGKIILFYRFLDQEDNTTKYGKKFLLNNL